MENKKVLDRMSRGRGEEGRGGIFEGGSSAGGGIGGERRMRRMGVWRESRGDAEGGRSDV